MTSHGGEELHECGGDRWGCLLQREVAGVGMS
jgi:hypothetical protein